MSKIELEDRITEIEEAQRMDIYHQNRQQESENTNQKSLNNE